MLCWLLLDNKVNQLCISICPLSPTAPSHSSWSSQSPRLSSLSYTAASHEPAMLHRVVCICQCYSQSNLSLWNSLELSLFTSTEITISWKICYSLFRFTKANLGRKTHVCLAGGDRFFLNITPNPVPRILLLTSKLDFGEPRFRMRCYYLDGLVGMELRWSGWVNGAGLFDSGGFRWVLFSPWASHCSCDSASFFLSH